LVLVLTVEAVPRIPSEVARGSGVHGSSDSSAVELRTQAEVSSIARGQVRPNEVLGKHSGRHALAVRLKDLGLDLARADLDRAFRAFKALADRKKEVYDDDLIAILTDEAAQIDQTFQLDYFHVLSGSGLVPSATVSLAREGQRFQETATGNGPVEAVLNAIDAIT